jgi:hypothetical protein
MSIKGWLARRGGPSARHFNFTSTFDTLYCTVDLSNVEEEERGRANASKIRQGIEEEMRKEP